MKPHPDTQGRFQTLHSEIAPIVAALILAAIAGAKAGISFDERGNLKPVDEEKLTDEQRSVIAQMAKANTEFAGALEELMTATAQFLTATQALPRTIMEGCVQVAAFQLDYESAAREAQDKTEAWRSLDVQSSRTRVDVAARLQAGGMSQTAADKAASGDSEYTTLKDAIAAALSEKEGAEIERDVCFQRLQTARALLSGSVQMSVAKIGAPTVVIREPATKEEPPKSDAPGATGQATQG